MKKNWTSIIIITIFFAGIAVMLYPLVSNLINTTVQRRMISEYKERISEVILQEDNPILKSAQMYNQQLAENSHQFSISKTDLEEYYELLNPNGNGIMGYLEIKKINLKLPIYHGVDETVLEKGVGHFMGSSFPIRGESVHSVLFGHRGLPSSMLFTNLDRLETGDYFTITVLNEKCSYQVEQVQVVDPEDLSSLEIVPNQDYVTLVTCTPYGVNTQRLIVRGVKMNEQIENTSALAEQPGIDGFKIFLLVVVPLIVADICLAIYFIWKYIYL